MPLKSSIKTLVKSKLPGVFRFLKSLHKSWRFRVGHGGGEYRAKKALVQQYGKRVITGPFEGLVYGNNVVCSAYVAKLVGSYEAELHGIIEEVVQSKPTTIIDVGCAEGYYAVGLAKRLPDTEVYAFDIDTDAQRFCTDLAKRNNVLNKVHVRGFCDHEAIRQLTQGPAFILCDCEGFELELLDPKKVPSLANCDILVEFHDFIIPDLTQQLQQRFATTHSVRIINTVARDIKSYPCLEYVPPADRELAVREGRPSSMQWGFFQPLKKAR